MVDARRSEQERAFQFLRANKRQGKPRTRGVTEIRGPYYAPVGRRYLEDIFDTVGEWVDILKFSGGSFTLMPTKALREIFDLAHKNNVLVSTGGFIEFVVGQGASAVDKYLTTCKEIGFDIVEVSSGFITVPQDDLVALVKSVKEHGLIAKPEVGIQFGAGGASAAETLEAEGTRSVEQAVKLAERYLDTGVKMVMIESEGITENVRTWRTDAADRIVNALGLENVMFEAADPAVFGWYVKNFGPEVNVFVDHSQLVQLECLRAGIWGTSSLWGRVVTYKP